MSRFIICYVVHSIMSFITVSEVKKFIVSATCFDDDRDLMASQSNRLPLALSRVGLFMLRT